MTATSTSLTSKPGSDGSGTIAIRISELWKRYGKLDAVRGISFEVGKGEIFGLIGPDGAGKTRTSQCTPLESVRGSLTDYQNPVPLDILEFQIRLAVAEARDLEFVPATFRTTHVSSERLVSKNV